MATTSSTSTSTMWRRSVRRRTPVSEREEDERELGRRAEELEETVEELRGEKDAAEVEEAALRAELDAERGAAEMAASETMLMIERLQQEKAAALLEARQFRRLAEGRVERDYELQDELASLSALAGGYLSLLRAHGIDSDGEDGPEEADGDSGMDVKGAVIHEAAPPPPAEKELEYTIDVGCAAATKAMAAVVEEQCTVVVVDGAVNLYRRVEALEADRAATRREVASLRAEPTRVVLAREMARLLCREAVAAERAGAVTTAQKSRFSVPAICRVDVRLVNGASRHAPAPGEMHHRAASTPAAATDVIIGFIAAPSSPLCKCNQTPVAAAGAWSGTFFSVSLSFEQIV